MAQLHKTIDYNGRRIHYKDEGCRCTKTVILLHGLAQNLTVWNAITLKMLNSYRVVSIDLPGHGFTDHFSEIHTMEFITDIIKEVVNREGLRDFVIVGHSWGGYAALAYAEKYPQSVKGIGLLHSHAMADDELAIQRRERDCEEICKNSANYILRFVPSLFSDNNIGQFAKEISSIKDICLETKAESLIAAEKGMMRRKSMMDFLKRFDRPVMFVYGKDDKRISWDIAMGMATLPQYSELLFLDRVGHMAHIEAPAIVIRWLGSFIDTCYMDLKLPRAR